MKIGRTTPHYSPTFSPTFPTLPKFSLPNFLYPPHRPILLLIYYIPTPLSYLLFTRMYHSGNLSIAFLLHNKKFVICFEGPSCKHDGLWLSNFFAARKSWKATKFHFHFVLSNIAAISFSNSLYCACYNFNFIFPTISNLEFHFHLS